MPLKLCTLDLADEEYTINNHNKYVVAFCIVFIFIFINRVFCILKQTIVSASLQIPFSRLSEMVGISHPTVMFNLS